MIAGDPDLVAWLATTKARTLHESAARLVSAGHRDAAELVRLHADALTTGNRSPF